MSDESPTVDSNSPGDNRCFIRLKSVNEINSAITSNETEINSENTENIKEKKCVKRKIPAWLLQSSNTTPTSSNVKDDGQKRQKLDSSSINNDCNTETNEISGSALNDESDKKQNDYKPNTLNIGSGSIPSIDTETDNETKTKIKIKKEIKVEPDTSSNTNGATSSSEVVKQEATSTTRESCKYGIKCYRRNPMHRIEMAHPGDNDYKRPNYPQPPIGTPDCPYGDRCYRRNPMHFQEYSHPPSTDFEKNRRERKKQKQTKQKRKNKGVTKRTGNEQIYLYDDEEEEDEDDPFATDTSEDYIPSDDDYSEDEFESENNSD